MLLVRKCRIGFWKPPPMNDMADGSDIKADHKGCVGKGCPFDEDKPMDVASFCEGAGVTKFSEMHRDFP